MNLDPKMTVEVFIAEAKRLRSAADAAEIDFLEFLWLGESLPHLWRGTGLDYVSFIERSLCRATRYLHYRQLREQHGYAVVRSVGIHGLMAAAKLATADQQRAVIAEVTAWESTNGTAISSQSADRIARDVRVRTAVVATHHRSYPEIAAENVRLRIEIERLRQRLTLMRGELAALKQKARGPKVKKTVAA